MINLPNIGILMPGDMGHGCGKVLIDNGFKVFTCLKDRSRRTKSLSKKSGIIGLNSFEKLLEKVDIILSILPPEFALSQANLISKLVKNINENKILTYVDCNAISPKTAKIIGNILSSKKINFIDGGIIGFNPILENGKTRLYVSGKNLIPINILDGKCFRIKKLGSEIGRASAIKMIYAGATKGTFALHAAVISAARKLNLFNEYVEELKYSKPNILQAMQQTVPKIPLDAKRWEGEMLEIVKTYDDVNITSKFHQGAADIMNLADKTPISKETRENFNSSRTLIDVVDMFVEASKK